MTSDNNEKIIERKARFLLRTKAIPSQKMDVVYSLKNNKDLTPLERYSAIVDIIKSCPDKIINKPEIDKTREKPLKADIKSQSFIEKFQYAPTETGYYVDDIYRKYKKLKLFKKRYLIHVNNRIGIGFQKRLIPNKRLIKALRDVIAIQEKILSRLPAILMEILGDETIDNPIYFNYLRDFRRWIIETPIIKYDMYEIKWMDRSAFESELQSYIIYFNSFLKLDIEIKEQILLLVENKLREMDDLRKEEINEGDSLIVQGDKDKRNLAREKLIYEYMTIMRSFLPTDINSDSVLSNIIKIKYKIDTFPEFLLIMLEALVFQKEITLNEVIAYYEISPPVVDTENWDYSIEYLKKVGKDSESRKKRHVERLKEELVPYNELNSLLKLRMEGQRVIHKAFETQWKVAEKRQKEFGHIYNDDFFTFLDECVNYFNNIFVPVLNGTTIQFEDTENRNAEGKIFTSSYFLNELNSFSNLVNDMHHFRSNNPSMVISRDEAMRILNRELNSMSHIEKFILLIGDIFNQMGDELQRLYNIHCRWILDGDVLKKQDILKTPLDIHDDDSEAEKIDVKPIPFYNYKVIGFKESRILSKHLLGKSVLTDSLKGGIYIYIMAFAYQIAYECKNENILSRISKGKEITRKIKELS